MRRATGSVKRQYVAPDLQEEREKLAFDQAELGVFLTGGAAFEAKYRRMVDTFGADPALRNYN